MYQWQIIQKIKQPNAAVQVYMQQIINTIKQLNSAV